MSQHYNVLGLGQPLLDKIVRIEEGHLEKLGIKAKGGSQLLQNHKSLQQLWDSITALVKGKTVTRKRSNSFTKYPIIVPGKCTEIFPSQVPVEWIFNTGSLGGSCSNTIKGLASLGESCATIGKIGNDEMGKLYKDSMAKRGVYPVLVNSKTTPTGECICMITPDGERTMRTYLGASQEMNYSDLRAQDFKNIKLLHVEGYAIYNKPLTLKAMQLAKANNALISLSLGSFELVQAFRDTLIKMLATYVDIVFANEEEAKAILGGKGGSAEQALDYMASLCTVAVVTLGKNGCVAKSGDETIHCPVEPVPGNQVVDTTGAGDLFASGFLYGYLHGYTLQQCAGLGCLAGREVVQVVGAELKQESWNKIKRHVNSILYQKSPKKNSLLCTSVPRGPAPLSIRKFEIETPLASI